MASEQQPGFPPTALISSGPSSSVTCTLLCDAPQATRALAPLTEVFPLPLRFKGVLTHTGTAKVIGIRELGAFLFEEGGSLPLPADNWRLGLWLGHHFTNAQKMVPPRPSKQKFATRNSSWQRWVSGHVPSALLTSAHPSQRPPLGAKIELPVGGKAASLSGESQNGHSNEIGKQFSKVTGGSAQMSQCYKGLPGLLSQVAARPSPSILTLLHFPPNGVSASDSIHLRTHMQNRLTFVYRHCHSTFSQQNRSSVRVRAD